MPSKQNAEEIIGTYLTCLLEIQLNLLLRMSSIERYQVSRNTNSRNLALVFDCIISRLEPKFCLLKIRNNEESIKFVLALADKHFAEII